MERATVDGLDVRVHRGGSGPPLLYLHSGLGEAGRTPFVSALEDRFEVLAPELPGFGGSEAPRWHGIEDAVFFLRALLDDQGWESGRVCGSSLGGWLSAELAVWHPGRVTGLALFSPVGLRVEGTPLADMFMSSREKMITSMFVTVPDPYDAALGEALEASDGDVILHSYRALEATARIGWNPYLCDPKLEARLGRCPAPATVIRGSGDAIVPAPYAEAYARAFPSGRLLTLDGVGHVPVVEAPGRAADVAVEALEGAVA